MNNNLDTPEPNEGLITYTYDDYDRLLYRNVYEGDRSSFKHRFGNAAAAGIVPVSNTQFGPKKLLYQDVYNYNYSTGQRETRRVYQPIIEIVEFERASTTVSTVVANIMCRSNVLVSGFISDTDKEAFLQQFLYPIHSVLFNGANRFQGKSAVGTISQTFTTEGEFYVKAYAMVETGVLFSKTVTIPAS